MPALGELRYQCRCPPLLCKSSVLFLELTVRLELAATLKRQRMLPIQLNKLPGELIHTDSSSCRRGTIGGHLLNTDICQRVKQCKFIGSDEVPFNQYAL